MLTPLLPSPRLWETQVPELLTAQRQLLPLCTRHRAALTLAASVAYLQAHLSPSRTLEATQARPDLRAPNLQLQ